MGNPKILVIKNFLKQNFTLKNNLTRLIFVVIGIAIVLSYCLPIYFNLKNLSEGEHGSGFIFINIQHNSGISFSMFNDSPNTAKFLQCFVVICIFISLLFFKKWYYLLLIGMAFTGGMFNFVDRCANGSVLDYFSFSFASGNS
ncbi:hypothetical protein FACS189459_0870 [Bacilli bacterium]|nr:hypothetical protein FACS189459_0870 [Bacilli bacterium]